VAVAPSDVFIFLRRNKLLFLPCQFHSKLTSTEEDGTNSLRLATGRISFQNLRASLFNEGLPNKTPN
jgi:hypothetical protein